MLSRVGVLIVASIAVYATNRIIANSFKSESPTCKPSGTAEESFRYCKDGERTKDEEEERVLVLTEVGRLRNVVNDLERTQEKLERELFVYYGLEQQEMEIAEMKYGLEMKTDESNRLSAAIKRLQVENKKLKEETRGCVLAKNELEKAKTKIKELQKKIRVRSTHPTIGHEIMMLDRQVASFRTDKSLENDDARIQAKLEAGRELELEAMELRRKRKELQLETRVLAVKLVVAQARISAASDTTESEVIKRLKVRADAARLVNEDLSTQVEELQKNRFDIVEEVVYQRWINACLRHEIQNYQTPQKSSTSDVESVYSQQSSTERESKGFNNFSEDNSSATTQTRRKTSLIHRLKRWRNSFDGSSIGSSLRESSASSSKTTASSESARSRRSSFSAGSFGASALKKLRDRVAAPTVEKDTNNSPKFRRRRVSFNDSLNTVIPAEEKSSTGTESVKRMRRRVSLSDLLRSSTTVVDNKYPNYRGRRQMVFELQKPIKNSDRVRTEVFATPETGESITSSPVHRSTEDDNTDDESMMTRQTDSKITLADHTEETTPVVPKMPDINITDAISTLFLFLVFLYLFLRCITLWCYSKPSSVV